MTVRILSVTGTSLRRCGMWLSLESASGAVYDGFALGEPVFFARRFRLYGSIDKNALPFLVFTETSVIYDEQNADESGVSESEYQMAEGQT